MKIFEVTGIGRIIDPRYPSNRFAAFFTLLAGAVHGAVTLPDGFGDAVQAGILGGGAAFLAWTVGREIDPDRPASAVLAAIGAAALAFGGDPGLGLTALTMVAARIAVRSTGVAIMPVDALVVIAGSAYVATRPSGFPLALVMAGTLLADTRLPGGSRLGHLAAAGTLGASLVAATISGTMAPDPASFDGWAWLPLATAVLGAVLVLRPPVVTAKADATRLPLEPRRVRAARLVALCAVAGALIWGGADGAWAAGPVSVAMVASLAPQAVAARVPMSAR